MSCDHRYDHDRFHEPVGEDFFTKLLMWPAYVVQHETAVEALILMLLGLVFWFAVACFGIGALCSWLILR